MEAVRCWVWIFSGIAQYCIDITALSHYCPSLPSCTVLNIPNGSGKFDTNKFVRFSDKNNMKI